MKRAIALGAGLLTASALGIGGTIARRLTAPAGPRIFDLTIRDIKHDDGTQLVVLDRTDQTTTDGIFNLWLEHGGWAQLSAQASDRGPGRIARTVVGTSPGLTLRVGDRASWSGIYYATPADAGLNARDITITTPAGPCPAWRIDGDPSTWAIHIHGLGSTRAGTLRGTQAATELGYSSLLVTYRNTTEGPRVGTGRSTLGHVETADVDEAIGYAVRRGAERIVLFGWSMGAAITLQLAARTRHDGLITALVLDSPVLDWAETIKANCSRSGLPASAGLLAVPWLTLGPPAIMVGLPEPIPLRRFDWITRAAELATPTLILHGTNDSSAPIRLSKALRERRPELVTLETFDADHTLAWNSDPERWRAVVSGWLAAQPVT
ncbi:alpha/beta hydrolase family protein [Micrococcus luteus]|uniref:alpha/beta hydrolase family protein n=1 Tax=Micrococcus luteus TaxID=1270 RepID=UPI0019D12D28|nr:alpha/beta hydrolase [Micrococcus luteus]MBN6750025.1 alpha/beta hydrolase [Micrococcus luteus]MBN6759935.1 alpha/beta hydrolase [Micrococcus luteus]MBN6801575.1 alpha/beta hydrolase [Micrococcus luteus]MDO5092483.1 alpha/beta hydrolase [Propionibacteriaceae bacterium]